MSEMREDMGEMKSDGVETTKETKVVQNGEVENSEVENGESKYKEEGSVKEFEKKSWTRNGAWKMPRWAVEEDFVVSGISGRFPESDNIEELKANLYGKVDMASEIGKRSGIDVFQVQIPGRAGQLRNIDVFDSVFFGIHGKKVDDMDPQQRLLLEVTYEALFDAGIEPSTLRGKNIGVFVGCNDKCNVEDNSVKPFVLDRNSCGLGLGLMANTISNAFDFTGPSFSVDTACSASFHGLNEALLSLRSNRCEAAIVAGCQISINLFFSHIFWKLGLTSKEGKCRVFDASANGYVRSEGVVAALVQRRSQAKRCYTTILHSKLNNDGATNEGITFPKAQVQKDLYEEVYNELDMNPADVDFLEAHGTGTVAGDREEALGISDFFIPYRDSPLMVGSVKSNMGHAEGASGLVSMVKAIINMEEERLIPGIHFDEPNPEVPDLVNGKLNVIIEPTPWKPGIVAINNFGFGGSNCHVVLKCNEKGKQESKSLMIPRLAVACGRSKSGVEHTFRKVKEDKFNVEAIHLLELASMAPTSGMCYRGYALVENEGIVLEPVIQKIAREKPLVWFFVSESGSPWPGIAKDMMKIDAFKTSVNKCGEFLRPLGVDLVYLLTEANEKELSPPVVQRVTIIAIQIALLDAMKALGIKPDCVVCTSNSNVAADYAKGLCTAQEAITKAYGKGETYEASQSTKRRASAPLDKHNYKNVTTQESSPDYLTKELNQVLSAVPRKAVLIAMALDSMLQDKLKEILHTDSTYVGLMDRRIENNAHHFLSSIGRLYLSSLNPAISNLYEPIEYPVPRGTAMLNSLIRWDHKKRWLSKDMVRLARKRDTYYVDVRSGSPYEYFQDYKVNDRVIFPASGFLWLIWDVYCAFNCKTLGKCPVVFEDMTFHRQSFLPENGIYEFSIKQIDSSGDFQVLEDNLLIVSGKIRLPDTLALKTTDEDMNVSVGSQMEETVTMDADDFYKELRFRGYNHGIYFKPVLEAESSGLRGRIKWEDRWATFLDAMLQIPVLSLRKRAQRLPKRIRTIRIDPSQIADQTGTETQFFVNPNINVYKAGPVEIQGIHWEIECEQSTENTKPVIEKHVFSPFFNYNVLSDNEKHHLEEYSKVCSGLAYRISKEICNTSEGVSYQITDLADIPNELLEKYRNSNNENYVLFRLMHDALYPPFIIPEEKEEIIMNVAEDSKKSENRKEEEGNITSPECSNDSNKITRMLTPADEKEANPTLGNENEKDAINAIDKTMNLDEIANTLKQTLITEHDNKKPVSNQENENTEPLKSAVRANVVEMEEVVNKNIDENSDQEITEITGKCSQTVQERLLSLLDNNEEKLKEDCMTCASFHENSLRASLDVVQMNTVSQRIRILEVCAEFVMHKYVAQALDFSTMGTTKVDYEIASIGSKAVSSEHPSSVVKRAEWDTQRPLSGENDLVISKDLFTYSNLPILDTLKALSSAVRDDGFIIITERTKVSPAEKFIASLGEKSIQPQDEPTLECCFSKLGLLLIAKKKDMVTSVTYVLRKNRRGEKNKVPEYDIVRVPENIDQLWVEDLKWKMMSSVQKTANRLIWLLAENSMSGILGLFNCLRKTTGGENLRLFINGTPGRDSGFPDFLSAEVEGFLRADLSVNVYRNGVWGQLMYQRFGEIPSLQLREYAFMKVMKRGVLSSVQWVESDLECFNMFNENQDKILVNVYYAALNFRDMLVATNQISPNSLPGEACLKENILGLEFSGRDEKGRRVMGVRGSQAMATSVAVQPEMVLEVPEKWSLEEASTVSLAYLTAYYALVVRGKIIKGISILIHSGSGGVGQAAIAVALNMGCVVYVSVGSEEKKQLLKDRFPELDDSHFTSSADDRFEFDILKATKGRGVQVILNSLSQEMMMASMRCLSIHGLFLQIGHFDVAMNSKLGMAVLLKNITVLGIQLDSLLDSPISESPEMLECIRCLKQGISDGVVKPIKSTIFGWNEAEEALRLMTSGKHIGKVIIKMRDEESDNLAVPSRVKIPCIPRTYCHPEKCFIVAGELDGLGFEVAHWLVERGARKLTLSSRSTVRNNYQRHWINHWENQGVKLNILHQDIKTPDDVKLLLSNAVEMGTVQGILYLCSVSQDRLIDDQKISDFDEVWNLKANPIINLDNISRQLCPELEHFVVFSSSAPGRGSAGQSSWGYANSFVERLIEQRKSTGFPGLVIQWGGIEDQGLTYDRNGRNDAVVSSSLVQKLNSCLSTLDRFMQDEFPVVSSFVPLWKTEQAYQGNIIESLRRRFGIRSTSSPKAQLPLHKVGLDVLHAATIKKILRIDFDLDMTVFQIRNSSLNKLSDLIALKTEQKNPTHLTPVLISDTTIPAEVLVPLNSVQSDECVFFIHSMESNTTILKRLAQSVNKRAYGLQFTKDVPHETVQDIACHYVQKLKEAQPEGPYHLCGYSYGSVLALEMARQLQREDVVKTVICIDNSPAVAVGRAKSWFSVSEDMDKLAQVPFELIADTYFAHISENDRSIIKHDIMDTRSTMAENIAFFLDIMQTTVSKDNMEALAKHITPLAKAISNFKPDGLYRGNVTLIKSYESRSENNSDILNTPDYELKKSVDGTVEVLELACSQREMFQEKIGSMAQIINFRTN